MHAPRTIDVPRVAGEPLGFGARRARRRALQALSALDALGEPRAYRLVASNGSEVPAHEITAQDRADITSDLEQLASRDLPSPEVLVDLLYAASSHHDRSRVPRALDGLLDYVDHWSVVSPGHVAELFERLDPSRLVRAVGQTLLAATRLDRHRSPARQAFLARFIADLRARGTPEATIDRLGRGLDS